MFVSALALAGGVDGELGDLVRRAWTTSPRVKAARYRVEQYLLRHEELEGFGDPSVYAAVGMADHSRSVPGSNGYQALTNNAGEFQSGIELPVQPGAYVTLGASDRWFHNPADQGAYYQTLVGLRVRIPLLRDRGFRQWDIDRARTLAEYHAVLAELTQELQDLRRDTEKAYLNLQQAYALAEVAKQSTLRSQKLFDEATELVGLR
ncbi:MAG: TolC family protein, partial [Lentisphaeria bacterium]|nr:TolC family protein [Lentisphaeria bacterium]